MDFPNRKTQRLKGYDYSQNGAYFITMCTQDRQNIFGEIKDGGLILNGYGKIVDECISKIGLLHDGVAISCKIVMPNHIHFIVQIVGVAYHATLVNDPLNIDQATIQQKSKMLIPKLIQQFKSVTVKMCKSDNTGLHDMQPLRWQRNYYDHIIRNQIDYQKTWEYINTNPLKWHDDCYYV